MKWFYIIAFLYVIVISEGYGDNSLKISVYYETLCPDCIRFITKQLFPLYKSIGNVILLDLIPFGKATIVNDTEIHFVCQHGPKECYGNEIHSCAIAHYSVAESTDFVSCTMHFKDKSNLDMNFKKCAKLTGISWSSLEICHKSGQGVKLLVKNGLRTRNLRPPVKFVPTIVFDGTFNQTLQDLAVSDLKEVVCELLYYEPDICKNDFSDDVEVMLV